MCGIVGIVNGGRVSTGLLAGLQNLEYRGYDSVGIATLGRQGLQRRRAQGKITALRSVLKEMPLDGPVGIGHTRWATHGAPTERNAHPHIHGGIAVVHNGIIENFKPLRETLIEDGIVFQSDTDSEVIPALIARYCDAGLKPVQAIRAAASLLEGQYALAVLIEDLPGMAFATRQESPLVIGGNGREGLIASDMLAFAGRAEEEVLIENGDIAVITRSRIDIFDAQDTPAIRPVRDCTALAQRVGKAGHRHFMHKEIHEQKVTVPTGLDAQRLLSDSPADRLPDSVVAAHRLSLVACGTSYYAGAVARDWIEDLAGIPVDLDIASEFRYRTRPIGAGSAALFISQSGETADTLSCLRMAKDLAIPTVSIVNVPTSAMAREADATIETLAGPEIGVASTKAFTAQLTALLSIAVEIGHRNGSLSAERLARLTGSVSTLPEKIQETLALEPAIKKIAHTLVESRSAIFVGRGMSYALALEGALKLKEISYIHAEGFAAGELKHGPIALIDDQVPAIVIAPKDRHFQKTLSNAQEVAARHGKLVVLSNAEGCALLDSEATATIALPETDAHQAPFLYAIALQMLAYHAALAKGTDVDQPRNLAKSVTVE